MIICLEGVNGAGKTALSRAVLDRWLTAGGVSAVTIEPVRHTDYGRQVWEAIMAANDLHTEAEALGFASARLHAAAHLARTNPDPLRDLVVIERWSGAVVAYGRAAAADPNLLSVLECRLIDSMNVDYTALVDVPAAVAARRLAAESNPNRFETQGESYLERVRQGYLAWARERDVPVVSGVQDAAAASTWADELVSALLGGLG